MPVKDRTKETSTTLIHRFVQQGSIVYTDCWKGYIDVHKYFEHYTVNHSIRFKDPVSGVHTNTIEGNCLHLKNLFLIDGELKKKSGFLYYLVFIKEMVELKS